jgi:Fur family ferric uptake transcriptional regulator
VPSRAKTKKNQPQPQTQSTADFQKMLRGAGLRSTGPRVAVLRFLHASGEPNSHGELSEALAGDGYDRATLYRNLMDLAEAGLVTRTDLGDHTWRFELKRPGRAGHNAEHPHFVCTDCGEVSCLPGVAVKIGSASGAPKSITSKDVSVQIKGLCDTCA